MSARTSSSVFVVTLVASPSSISSFLCNISKKPSRSFARLVSATRRHVRLSVTTSVSSTISSAISSSMTSSNVTIPTTPLTRASFRRGAPGWSGTGAVVRSWSYARTAAAAPGRLPVTKYRWARLICISWSMRSSRVDLWTALSGREQKGRMEATGISSLGSMRIRSLAKSTPTMLSEVVWKTGIRVYPDE